jgi:hypothetical protein
MDLKALMTMSRTRRRPWRSDVATEAPPVRRELDAAQFKTVPAFHHFCYWDYRRFSGFTEAGNEAFSYQLSAFSQEEAPPAQS